MIIKDSDIATYKVNWKNKSENIAQLSKELSLNTNSFVFWDDNPLEREKVKKSFKDIYVVEPDKDISNWANQLLNYTGFTKYIVTREDRKKTGLYKSRSSFLSFKKASNNEILFLKKTNISPKIEKINRSNLSRASQLSIKTNQFNFNSKRLIISDFAATNQNNQRFIIRLKDKYGDHGYVGLVSYIVTKKFIFVDQFLLSCRILGRYLENWILNEIKKICIKRKIPNLFFEFVKTEKNLVAQDFIKSNKFKVVSKKEIVYFNKSNDIKGLLSNSNSIILSFKLNGKIEKLEIYGNRKQVRKNS